MSLRPAPTRAPSAAARASARPQGRAEGARSRTASAAASADRPQRGDGEPRHVTLRSIGLVVVLLVAFIVLAPTLRAYVTQQEQLRELNSQLADTNDRIAELEAELERWNDPNYVRQQARDRFSYVEPGETAYRVIDPETVTGEDPVAELTTPEASAYVPRESDPWYLSVWESIEIAGAAEDALEGE